MHPVLFVEFSSGLAFNQELCSRYLFPKTPRTVHFWYCFAQFESLYIAQFTIAEWVVDVIMLQVGFKCFSMRMTFDLFDKLLNTKFSASCTTACDNSGTLKSFFYCPHLAPLLKAVVTHNLMH